MLKSGRFLWSIPLLLFSLCSPCLGGETSAALDPQQKTPYEIRVVLTVAEHRMLTPFFQKQLETELRDQLQLMLGKLAHVQVVRFHPLVSNIRAKGLKQVLETWDEASDEQTHFVLIDFADGQYVIQTGKHDGMTNFSSPVVRREVLTDRQRVPDAVAQMVRKDFGVVGTFQKLDTKQHVKLAIKGGALVESLSPWVRVGDVFSVVRISDNAGKARSHPIEWAVLQVTDVQPDGFVRCRYFCRYAEDRKLNEGPAGAGYRCVQLSTISGPVRLRLVNEKTQEYLNGFRVVLSADAGFKIKKAQGTTTIRGLLEPTEQFSHVAYVQVLTSDRVLAEFPIPIVDDRIVVCRMSPDFNAMKEGELELRKAQWTRWNVDALALADKRLGEYNEAVKPDKLPEALNLGRKHLEAMTAEIDRLAAERSTLEKLAKDQKITLDLSFGTQYGDALTGRQKQLAMHLEGLDKRIKEVNSPERHNLIAKITNAELLEKQAEFDKAIELYEEVVKDPSTKEIKVHLDQLKANWAPKSPEHAKARQFIYSAWPTFDLTAVAANVGQAKESFQTCKGAGDRMTPLKLMFANVQHLKDLGKELEALRRAPGTEDNQARWKAMLELVPKLQNLQTAVEAWVAGDKKAAK